MRRGQEALADGRLDEAVRWLRRARRYAPDDATPLLSLAGALLASGAMAEAAGYFETVAGKSEVQAAWLGAAIARLRLDQPDAAARAVSAALSGHRWRGDPDARALPDRVAEAARAPGWCGLDDDDAVVVSRSGLAVRLTFDGTVAADGERVPPGTVAVTATTARGQLLGSPLQVRAIRRVEGMVEVLDGGLAGWAWHPGDSDRDPLLTVRDARGRRRLLLADDAGMLSLRPLMRPRRFAVSASDLAGLTGPLTVQGSDARDLAGSPLHPGMEALSAASVAGSVARCWPLAGRKTRFAPLLAVPATASGPAAVAACDLGRRVAVVVPAYRGLPETRACLESVLATVPEGTAVIVVDDCSPEPELAALLDALAATGRIRLLRHASNLGFPAAANAGLRAAAEVGDCDVVLLNSDTRTPAGWLERLRAAAHSAADIGTATPLSNDASIVSYPEADGGNAPPDAPGLRRIAKLAAAANAGCVVDLPTGIGFCLYIRRECMAQVGLLREDVFAQGYGEENDFCLRARHLGWRHVAVPAVYVAHLGAQSFGDAREALAARNIAVLERLYPGYRAMIADWIGRDPLAAARRRLDAARWQAYWRGRAAGSVVLVTHDAGGGVERCVRERCAAVADTGQGAIVLRPVLERRDPDRSTVPGLCAVSVGAERGSGDAPFPNLVFRLPDELDELAVLLRVARPVLIEVHHMLGHVQAVLRLAELLRLPYEVRVHDYAWFCARVSLIGGGDRYCGEPPVEGCEHCVDDHGSRLEEPIRPTALVARSAAVLARASRVVTPSYDTAQRLRRHFPHVAAEVLPHEPDRYRPLDPPPDAATRRVCVVGAIGIEKGFEVLLACARDAAARDLPLSFHVVGYTIGDERLLDTGRVEITGPFEEAAAVALIHEQRAAVGFVPGICAETWSFTLGQTWAAGLPVLAFDIGAVAERVRGTGRGWLLPLGAPAARVNAALLTPPR